MIGAYEICKDKIDGIVLISTFPCGLDSLANELLILKLKMPYLNIIIDDINGDAGIETRVESFIDILKNYNWLIVLIKKYDIITWEWYKNEM